MTLAASAKIIHSLAQTPNKGENIRFGLGRSGQTSGIQLAEPVAADKSDECARACRLWPRDTPAEPGCTCSGCCCGLVATRTQLLNSCSGRSLQQPFGRIPCSGLDLPAVVSSDEHRPDFEVYSMTPTTLVQSGGVPEVRIAERQHLNCMDIGAVGATGLPQSGNGSDGLAKLATPATPGVQSRQAQCVDSCAPFCEVRRYM